MLIGKEELLGASFSALNTTNQNVTWSSDNIAVATVTTNGLVKGISSGTANITVTSVIDGSKTAVCAVSVTNTPIALTGITLSKTTSSLLTGQSDSISIVFSPANTTDQKITWSSSNTSVVYVSATGELLAVGPGSATITAKASGNNTGICTVTVTQPVTGISLNKSSTSILTGNTETLTGTIVPANASNKTINWTSANSSIASVNASGVVTGVNAGGPVNITATSADGSFTAVCAVTVSNAPINMISVSLNKSSSTIAVGSTDQLTPSFNPSNATTQTVTWSSSNTGIATVSSSGLITAIAKGSATITVTTDEGSKTATCAVSVTQPVSSVSLNKSTTSINIGANETLVATVLPANANLKTITWTSDNTAVATVNSSGSVTGITKGTATITATTNDGGFTSTCTVTINKPVTGVSLNKSSALISIGNTVQLTATVSPADASNLSLNWTTSNSSIATVNSSGLVTGAGVGSATITCTTVDGSFTATCNIASHGLIITEVTNGYYSNYSTAVEIYNPTTSTIDISTYKLRANSRTVGSPYTLGSFYSFTLPSANIAPGEYVIIRANFEGSSLKMEGGTKVIYLYEGTLYPTASPTWGLFELTKGGVTSDFMRWGSAENGTPTTAGTWTGAVNAVASFTTGTSYIGYSKARDSTNTNTRSATDWTERKFSTLGGPNDVSTTSASDGDGIPNSAKAVSGTFAGLPLYTWGASSGQKDIFIHLDYMVNGTVGATDPGIIPQKAALDKVVAAFLAKGIHIHFDVGDLFGSGTANYNLDGNSHAVPYTTNISLGKASGFTDAYVYKNTYMPVAKNRVFYYMLFANSQVLGGTAGSSGIADISGNTSIITLGGWGLDTSTTAKTNELVNYQAATIMHEFGHNLGLHHGGNDDNNYKPNYFSIMNYLYQLNGLPTVGTNDNSRYYNQLFSTTGLNHTTYASFWTLADPSNWTDSYATTSFNINYSTGSGGSILETSINENLGIRQTGSLAIDFNVDSSLSSSLSFAVRYYLDPSVVSSTPISTSYSDFNDWSTISSVFQQTGMGYNSGVSPQGTPILKKILPNGSSTVVLDTRGIFENIFPLSSGECAPNPKKPQVTKKLP